MSHDRKPGRVRVIKPGDEDPQRRRDDAPPVIINAKTVTQGRKSGRRGQLVLGLLFVLAAGLCAAGTELFLPA